MNYLASKKLVNKPFNALRIKLEMYLFWLSFSNKKRVLSDLIHSFFKIHDRLTNNLEHKNIYDYNCTISVSPNKEF